MAQPRRTSRSCSVCSGASSSLAQSLARERGAMSATNSASFGSASISSAMRERPLPPLPAATAATHALLARCCPPRAAAAGVRAVSAGAFPHRATCLLWRLRPWTPPWTAARAPRRASRPPRLGGRRRRCVRARCCPLSACSRAARGRGPCRTGQTASRVMRARAAHGAHFSAPGPQLSCDLHHALHHAPSAACEGCVPPPAAAAAVAMPARPPSAGGRQPMTDLHADARGVHEGLVKVLERRLGVALALEADEAHLP